jgi:basic membrane protein A and related proteins
MNTKLKLYALAWLPLGALACSLLADSKLRGGIGVACSAPEDCQGDGADCLDGRCVLECSGSDSCPDGTSCAEDICDTSFRVGFVYDGNATVSGFARAHDEGRIDAKEALPWLDFSLVAQDIQSGAESQAITGVIEDGAEVVFVTTSRFRAAAADVASNNPSVRFFNFGVPSWDGDNFSGYVPRYHQAWYLSGIAVASVAAGLPETDASRFKFGFVGALPNPEVLTQLNAFTLGARSVSKDAQVDVVWVGGFVPASGVVEKALTYLIEDGNRFIVNRIGARNGDLMDAIEDFNEANPDGAIYGTVLDNEDCASRGAYCLGGPTWNWGPLYTRVLRELQRGTFDSSSPIRDPIQADAAESVINLTLNPAQTAFTQPLRDRLATAVEALTAGGDNTFAPTGDQVCATDPNQRPEGPCVEGRVEDGELDGLCWIVEGVVQREDPSLPYDETSNPLVPARTPEGELWPPPSFEATPVALSCI